MDDCFLSAIIDIAYINLCGGETEKGVGGFLPEKNINLTHSERKINAV